MIEYDLHRYSRRKEAPPDSLAVSLAMAMAIQTQFLKILLVDFKTAQELLALPREETEEAVHPDHPVFTSQGIQ